MKEAIAILTGGGPAPGMNTVVGSVAKTFLRKGYRVIGLHEGYTGLFNPSPRMVDIDYPMADGIFNQGGSFLQMSRFKPKDSDFENNFNLKFFTDNNIKLLVTVGGDDTASTANRIAKFLEVGLMMKINGKKQVENFFSHMVLSRKCSVENIWMS